MPPTPPKTGKKSAPRRSSGLPAALATTPAAPAASASGTVRRTVGGGRSKVTPAATKWGPVFRIPAGDRLPEDVREEALEIVRETARAVQEAWEDGAEELAELLEDAGRPRDQYLVRATLEHMAPEERVRRKSGGARLEFVLCYNHCD